MAISPARVEAASQSPIDHIVEQLRALLPGVVTADAKINWDELKVLLDPAIDQQPERYRFTWAGKTDAIRALRSPSWSTLVPKPDQSINFDATQHLFLEGDNLEVLKLLYKPYFGRVKMIYIDPPYNTGNDFIYPDNFADPAAAYLAATGQADGDGNRLTTNAETSGRYHSAWLTMLYPRLFLARQLLRDDGVIFVSIDDHEVANLRILMNEVFGGENFVAQIIVQTNPRGRTLDRYIARTHEYLIAYARDVRNNVMAQIPKGDDALAEYNKHDSGGVQRTRTTQSEPCIQSEESAKSLLSYLY